MTKVREIHLRSRPQVTPTTDNFEAVTVELPPPAPSEVQVRNLWMSVDPYMRGRMDTNDSYVDPYQLGKPLEGAAIGEVVASNDADLRVGDLVRSYFGWREGFNAPAQQVRKLPSTELPPQAFLGVAGTPGLTAYVGLTRIAQLNAGDTVFVTGAAGAVGSTAVQIAKAKGAKVVGSAGGPEKLGFLREIGCDGAIDYKAEGDFEAALRRCAPEGIDICFDNVGGDQLDAALALARPDSRFALCGSIYMYNGERQTGPANIWRAIDMKITLRGFICSDHLDMAEEFHRELRTWLKDGRIVWRETVREGLDSAPEALMGLFRGENIGKMLVKL